MGYLFDIVLILFLTLLNGVFSMSETAVVSARQARLQQRADAGDDRARAALELAQQPDRFLSAIQIGITLIGILAGAFGGSGLSDYLAHWLEGRGVRHSAAQSLAFGLVVALITYVSLVFGELVPKTLALNNPEGIASGVARPMGLLAKATAPLVWVLSVSTNGILRLLGVRPVGEAAVTEDEINILIRQGVQVGTFAEEERELVERVFRTADRRISGMMTPRREVVYLDVKDPWEVNREKIAASPHSAFPVCEDSLDNVLGIAVLKRIWHAGVSGKAIDLAAVAEPPIYALETTRALSMLERFRGAEGRHVALVVDEYGNVVGLVTLHDVLEGVVGEIPGAPTEEGEERSAVRREDGSWLLDGMLPVSEVLHLLDSRTTPPDAAEYQTLGGFVMGRLGRIPSVGDRFTWEGLAFEVVDMDGHRVDRVLVSKA